ncbi:hypothetical protein BH23VER1_BH23VER1_05970 [soil metagenome]
MHIPTTIPSLATGMALAAALFATSCETPTQSGALAGAGSGAAIGALIDHDNRGRGALIGGGLGTAVGGLAGAIAEQRRAEQFDRDRYYQSQPAYVQTQPGYVQTQPGYVEERRVERRTQTRTIPQQDNFPMGTAVGRDRVRSPYPPYTVLDTSGYPSGGVATDPTAGGQPFRIP